MCCLPFFWKVFLVVTPILESQQSRERWDSWMVSIKCGVFFVLCLFIDCVIIMSIFSGILHHHHHFLCVVVCVGRVSHRRERTNEEREKKIRLIVYVFALSLRRFTQLQMDHRIATSYHRSQVRCCRST